MSEGQRIDAAAIVKPTQLLAGLLILLLLAVPTFIGGAATVSEPAWAPAVLVIAAVASLPLAFGAVVYLITRRRINLLSDEGVLQLVRDTGELAPLVGRLRGRAGWDTAALVTGRRREAGDTSVRKELENEVNRLVAAIEQLEEKRAADIVPADALLESAKGLMVQERWAEAARYFDEYVRRDDGNWLAYFARGVAHMNTRGGESTDLAALRSFNDALALAPRDGDPNLLARLFTYRGAAEKRLRRLDEAEVDLLLAQPRATEPYEVVDNLYNLAGVYAMKGRLDDALDSIERLADYGALDLVRAHTHDYFSDLAGHPRFEALLTQAGSAGSP